MTILDEEQDHRKSSSFSKHCSFWFSTLEFMNSHKGRSLINYLFFFCWKFPRLNVVCSDFSVSWYNINGTTVGIKVCLHFKVTNYTVAWLEIKFFCFFLMVFIYINICLLIRDPSLGLFCKKYFLIFFQI